MVKAFMKTIIISFLILIIMYATFLIAEPSSKDQILNAYDSFIQFLGSDSLTKDSKLKGNRKFGVDNYVGTYTADYSKFTGSEYLFGGTTLERKNGDHIFVKVEIANSDGEIEVIMSLKENEQIIANEDGIYECDFYVENCSSYLIVNAKNYTGNLKIEIN